jgi:predicted NBD/HSP70 family sugar kinase
METHSGQSRPGIIGIGTPGVTNPDTGKLKNSNTQCLNGRPLREDLRQLLQTQVVMVNDANCFALAEAKLGAARDYGCVFGIIMGTGVGGGIVIDGEMHNGRHGIAGEWGHNVIEPDGSPCYCGKRGCVETVLSGPALEHYYESQSGVKRKLPEIVELSKSNDKHAMTTMERLRHFFGKALAQIINVLDPDAVVLGGGVGNIGILYEGATRSQIRGYLFNDALETPILKPQLGDSAGVLGAALIAASEKNSDGRD